MEYEPEIRAIREELQEFRAGTNLSFKTLLTRIDDFQTTLQALANRPAQVFPLWMILLLTLPTMVLGLATFILGVYLVFS